MNNYQQLKESVFWSDLVKQKRLNFTNIYVNI